jgi:hypothetical protein
MKKMTIQLTSEQQKQIKNATGKDATELNLSFGSQGELSESDLGLVQGGAVDYFLMIPGVPGESSASQREPYSNTTSIPAGMLRPLK